MYDKVTHNKRRAASLMAGSALVLAIVLGVIGMAVGLGGWAFLVSAVVAAAAVAAARWRADSVVLALSRAEAASEEDFARYHNLVEGLCAVNGLAKPDLYVIDDEALNAFATARGPAHTSLVLTTGLLGELNRLELEGVVAHELTRIRDHDAMLATLAVVLVAPVTVLSDRLIRHTWWNGGRHGHGHDDPEGKSSPALGSVGRALLWTSPVIARLLRMVVGRRELTTDLDAVEMTRYPPGLLRGLERMTAGPTIVHASARSTAHLWLTTPLALTDAEGELARWNQLFDAHPPLSQRVDALREL